jgi:hypothetical protein
MEEPNRSVDLRGNRAILAELVGDRRRAHHFPRRPDPRGQRVVALSGWPARQLASGVDDLRAVRVRIRIWVRRASARGALAAACRVLVRFALKQYYTSPLCRIAWRRPIAPERFL